MQPKRKALKDAVDEWLGDDNIRAEKPWHEHTLIQLVQDVGGNRLLTSAIGKRSEALHKNDSGHSPAMFRNMIIHGRPLQEEIELMTALYEAQSLWTRT